MYIWNGYTVIGKHKDLTEGMLETLDEAQAKLESSPSMQTIYRFKELVPWLKTRFTDCYIDSMFCILRLSEN